MNKMHLKGKRSLSNYWRF